MLRCALLLGSALLAEDSTLDLKTAVIVAGPPQRTAAEMLQSEIEKRTQLRLPIAATRPAGGVAFVLTRGAAGSPEGFTVTSSAEAPGVVTVRGNDARGVIFGTGYVLRQLRMGRQKLELDGGLNVTTAPKVKVRGHQLGYRPKTNSYDGWDVRLWEQYIRELAIFGNNTIELIPPRSDDNPDSPHFPLRQIDMMEEMSRLAARYEMDVSVWYPALDKDYSDPKTVDAALKEWGEVFRRLPRLDVIFVPGGDPGHTPPKHMMALLEKQTANLRKYHPRAEMWMSPQGFGKDWTQEFLAIMAAKPKWLSGIVFGPQNFLPLPELRAKIPPEYPIRFYPDITHSLHAQFPMQNWDWAYASTQGREGINPRPLGQAVIFRAYNSYTNGFVTYSEGCNDDVNKFVWSGLGWDPQADVKKTLDEYSRFFFGEDLTALILGLEKAWDGPLAANPEVDANLARVREIEAKAAPALKLNWRFQQLLYRACYDAFLQARLRIEQAQEAEALSVLKMAAERGSLPAMSAAETILDADRLTATERQLRARVFEMAEALFQSIRMQLSVAKYQAIGLRRGANLDAIDYALNNRAWLKAQFAQIRALASEPERLARLDRIVRWTDPGPGGFYDDLGQMGAQPHLVLGEGFEKDPAFLRSALISYGAREPQHGWRTSWYSHAEAIFDAPLEMQYTGLDPAARYRLRVTYAGDQMQIPMRLAAGGVEIHPALAKKNPPEPVEFDLPASVTSGGSLRLSFTRPPGLGGSGRGNSVAEVWLLKVTP